MKVIVSLPGRISLLPFFLKYYAQLGASRFFIIVPNGEEPVHVNRRQAVQEMSKFYPIESVLLPNPANGLEETQQINQVVKIYVDPEEWCCVADLDEFISSSGRTLQAMSTFAYKQDYDAVHGVLVDRVAS